MLSIIALIILFSVSVIALSRRKLNLWAFPGPPSVLPLVNFYSLLDNEKMLQTMVEYNKKYGNIFRINFFSETYLITTDRNFIKTIFTSKELITKSADHDFFKPLLGNGLFTSTDPIWTPRRKKLTPSFQYGNLSIYIKKFEFHAEELFKNLDNFAGQDSVDIVKPMAALTMDVIIDTAMGVKLNVQANPHHKYLIAIKEVMEVYFKRILCLINRYDYLHKFTNLYKKEMKLTAFINNFGMEIIQKRKKYWMSGNQDEVEENTKLSFLDILIKSNSLTDVEILEEVNTFLFAGIDTTSHILSCTLLCLAENQNIQDRVVSEINKVIGDDLNRSIPMEDLGNLKYLEMVIKETMRLYPAAPFLGRSVENDFDYNGMTIPKGVTLILNLFTLHRNEDIYPDPLKFDPERFDNPSHKPFEYLPFGAGHRNCIGQKFAMLEMKMVLAKILQRYKFTPVANFVPRFHVTMSLSAKNGLMVKVEKR